LHEKILSFSVAQKAFIDPNHVIVEDTAHSGTEIRFYCIGKVGGGIMNVRFICSENIIRIYGAGY